MPLVCRAVTHGHTEDYPVAKVTCSEVLGAKRESAVIVLHYFN